MSSADPVISLEYYGETSRVSVSESVNGLNECGRQIQRDKLPVNLFYAQTRRTACKVIWTAVSISLSAAEKETISSDPPASFRD